MSAGRGRPWFGMLKRSERMEARRESSDWLISGSPVMFARAVSVVQGTVEPGFRGRKRGACEGLGVAERRGGGSMRRSPGLGKEA